MGFLNTDSMPRLVEKLADGDNIKITGNSKGNRVGTVIKKIVEKADDVTKAIEQEVVNDSYSFKVGTGNVDVSADVEDGFGEVGIKGVTYQNVLPVGMFDSKENFYALGGQVSDLHSSFDGGYITLNATGSYGNAFVKLEKTLLKQNSKYTLILDIKNTNLTLKEEANPTTPSFAVASAHPSEAFVEWCFLGGNEYPLKNGIQKFLLTTKPDFTGVNWSTRMFISDKVASGSITFRFLLLEGDHTNNPNLPSYFEGIVGVGDKSKNLFNYRDIKTLNANTQYSANNIIIKPKLYYDNSEFYLNLESGKKYTLSCNKTSGGEISIRKDNSPNLVYDVASTSVNIVFSGQEGYYLRIGNREDITKDFSFNNIQITEGEKTTEYQPYGTHKIEILSCGKNLINWNKNNGITSYTHEGVTFSYNSFTQEFMVNGTATADINYRAVLYTEGEFVKFYKNKKYSFLTNKPLPFYIQISEKNVASQSTLHPNITSAQVINLDNKCNYLMIWGINKGDKFENLKFNLYLEEIPVSASYESYIEDKTQILLDEPLMRLPNGVCDEITRDGKLIRRVGKVVLDGSETWSNTGHGGHSTKNTFEIKLPYTGGLKGANNLCYCNRFPQGITSGVPEEGMYRVVYDGSVNKGIFLLFSPKISEIPYRDTNAWKQWLSKNPTTVYYELAEPIVTELPAPCLRIFKDGHLTFNTLVAPESTHMVQLNKSAQIERSIREVQGLDSRVGQLESFYDDMMLETSHKLNLLTYDFEYTKESEDI